MSADSTRKISKLNILNPYLGSYQIKEGHLHSLDPLQSLPFLRKTELEVSCRYRHRDYFIAAFAREGHTIDLLGPTNIHFPFLISLSKTTFSIASKVLSILIDREIYEMIN